MPMKVVSNDAAEKKEEEEEENESSCFSIIRDFSLNTTAHGLPGIARSESTQNCVYWTIALLIFTGFMIYMIVLAIVAYLRYPSQMDLSFDYEWPQYFPAFSFCNVGGIRLDLFEKSLLNYTTALNITRTGLFDSYLYKDQFIRDILNRNKSMEPYFFSLSSILIKCYFNLQPCSVADFIPYMTSTYGMCYTFNAQMKNESSQKVRYGNQGGGPGRLDLSFYVHSHQYIPYTVNSAGIVSLMHDNRRAPLLDAAGYSLIPGQHHIFSYQKKKISFLPSPYTSCSNKLSSWMRPMFDNYPYADYEYSRRLCVRLNLQMYTYEQCGCVNYGMWDTRSIIPSDSNEIIQASVCEKTNLCALTAADAYMNLAINASESSIQCPQECSMTDFIVKKSSLLAPLEWQMNDIKKFVENSTVPLPANWSTEWPNHVRTNYLFVTLERETNAVENHTQTASTSAIDLISNIGGQTGLWIGISLLSIMEVIEMIYRLIRYQCHRIRTKVRARQIITT